MLSLCNLCLTWVLIVVCFIHTVPILLPSSTLRVMLLQHITAEKLKSINLSDFCNTLATGSQYKVCTVVCNYCNVTMSSKETNWKSRNLLNNYNWWHREDGCVHHADHCSKQLLTIRQKSLKTTLLADGSCSCKVSYNTLPIRSIN